MPLSVPQNLSISAVFKSLHWLKIKLCIYYKILSLTCKVLTTTMPSYIHNLISIQPRCSACSSDVTRPPSSSSLNINNCSFCRACRITFLGNFANLLIMKTSLSSDLAHNSWPFSSSSLSSSITPSLFHSRLKTHVFHKYFPQQFFCLPLTWLTSWIPAVFHFLWHVSYKLWYCVLG